MLFRVPGLRRPHRACSHRSRHRVPTIHSARTQRIKRLETDGVTNPIERANNLMRLHMRKDSRRFNPNVNILEICRDKNYEAFVRGLMASEVRELTGEYVPGHEQPTMVDINRTQVLPFSDLYPDEEE